MFIAQQFDARELSVISIEHVQEGRKQRSEDNFLLTTSKGNRRVIISEIHDEVLKSQSKSVSPITVKRRLRIIHFFGHVAIQKSLLKAKYEKEGMQWRLPYRDRKGKYF